MATATPVTIQMKVAVQGFNDALNAMARAVHRLAIKAGMYDRYLAVLPGDWPDNFMILNRFLRTGRRPRWIAIPIDTAKHVG